MTENGLTRWSEWHEPIMGTAVEIQLVLRGENNEHLGKEIARSVITEMLRLQDVFSSVDPSSEFRRWLRCEVKVPSLELSEVLSAAARWQIDSGGRFNPSVATLSAAWKLAEVRDEPPESTLLRELAEAISTPPWVYDNETKAWRPDTNRECTLNALAKGWVVDAAIDVARAHPLLQSVTINAGGDIRRNGPDALLVGIENPFRPFDNEPPVTIVRITNQALATSGSSRKSVLIGGVRHSHVIDPRSGIPANHTASISVAADTAAEADAQATILGVEPPHLAHAEAQQRGLAAFIISDDGHQYRTEKWRAMETAAERS